MPKSLSKDSVSLLQGLLVQDVSKLFHTNHIFVAKKEVIARRYKKKLLL
jgi:hypothetical protein